MQKNQLEIQRSGAGPLARMPLWCNFAGVACAILLLVSLSIWTVAQSRNSLQTNVSSKLETILEIEVEAVEQWMTSQKQLAGLLAADHELAELMASPATDVDSSTERIPQKLSQISARLDHQTCLLMTVDGKVLASTGENWLLDHVLASKDQFCETLMSEKATVSPAFSRGQDSGSAEFATVIAAPVRSGEYGVVGFLGIGQNLTESLTEVLASSRNGKSGESIAVTRDGQLISLSRFESPSHKLPFEVSAATQVNLDGTPDHRGANSVTASRWLHQYGLGLITKMDHAEANAPINRVFYFVWTLFGLLLLTASSTLFYRWYLMQLRQRARQADLSSKRLGAYELEEKIGEGGMGVVYHARHALLRRPTAVKILPPEKSNRESVARFEREVQFTSKLKHPNTISIYDYGRTENGLFYYAMELLEGMNLQQLVEFEGPMPDGRVIEVLRQSCQSLCEAHSLGLVHRDIKPANIMLCNRGGAYDTVKVLDFGMVRDQSDIADSFGSGDSLSGTPMYMAPECFTSPGQIDERADIFALGAVAFFVLTGKPLFDVKSLDQLIDLQIKGAHVWAREQFDREVVENGLLVSEDVIRLVCDCLARIDDRPDSVSRVIDRLASCQPAIHWGRGSAEKWWSTNPTSREKIAPKKIETFSQSRLLEATQTFVPRIKTTAAKE